MEIFLTLVLVAAMLATVASLGGGILQMLNGKSAARSNRFMQSRVLFQGIAIIAFLLLMSLNRH